MVRALLIGLLLAGCSSNELFVALHEILRASAYLFFRMSGEAILEARAYETLPDPLRLPFPEDGTYRLLVFDTPLDTMIALPGDDGIFATLPAETPSAEAWSLLAPQSWLEIESNTFVPRTADLAPWLAKFKVPRPPCPPMPSTRPIRGTVTPTFDVTASVRFDELAGGRFGGELTAVALLATFETPTSRPVTHLVKYDEVAHSWSSAYAIPEALRDCPENLGSHLVLDVDGPGRGVVGLRNGPLVPFDLALPNGGVDRNAIVPYTAMCRNARTSVVLNGLGAAALGNLAVIGVEGNVVVVIEHAPSHPELPPRECYVAPTGLYAHRVIPIDQDTVFVGGYGLSGGVYLDFPR